MWRRSLAIGLIGLSGSLAAQVYHYVDQDGRKVYLDRLSQVPAEYRDQLKELFPAPATPMGDLQIQSSNSSATASERQRLQAQIAELEQPIRLQQNSVRLPVVLRQQGREITLNLILDTGASMTVIHSRALHSVNLPTQPSGFAQVAGGQRIATRRAQPELLQVGPYPLHQPWIQIIDFIGPAEHDGLLGMDFLQQAEYQLDLPGQRLIWKPQEHQRLQQALEQLPDEAMD